MPGETDRIVAALTRFGLAFVFLYAAVSSFYYPETWAVFLPLWLTASLNYLVLLKLFSAYQILLVIWLVSGRYIFYSAIVSAVTLLGIISTNIQSFDIVFRDVDILVSAVALAIIGKRIEGSK